MYKCRSRAISLSKLFEVSPSFFKCGILNLTITRYRYRLMMETTKRLTCEDCSNTYKSKATLYIHRRQYCLMRNTRAAQRRQNSLHNSPLNKKSASPNSSSPASRSSPSSAKPSIVKTPFKQQELETDPLAIDTPEQDKQRLKGEPQEIGEKRSTDEFEFTEDDIAYWKEFVLGTQC